MFRTNALLLGLAFISSANAQSTTAVYDRAINEHFTADAPGGSVLVAQGGKVIYERALGMADMAATKLLTTDNQFRIGSVSKQFAAVAILQLAEAGKLKLSDEIQAYVDYPKKEQPITVEHLLTHTSGIPNFTSMPLFNAGAYVKDITLPELIAFFADLPLEFAPGTKWNYSNSGYILLTAIIERVSGQSWTDYATEHLFTPAGMTQSSAAIASGALPNEAIGYAGTPQGWEPAHLISLSWPRGAGCIRSTVGDLWKWNTSVFAGKLVSQELLAKAHTGYILPDGTNTEYGYGWHFQNVQGSPTVEHNGGINGFVSASIYLPKEDIYVAVLVNRESDDANNLAPKLAAIALGKPYGGPEVPLTDAEAQAYTGVYVNAEGVERYITAEGSTLSSMRQGSTPRTLQYLGNDRFLFQGDVITLTFQRTEGKVTGAHFRSRDREEQLIRSDKPLPAPRKEIALKGADLQKYVGEYQLAPGFTLTFRAEGDRFFGRATGQEEFEVFGDGPHTFFLKVVDAKMEFHVEADGSVQRMTFDQGGPTEAKRVK
jgi:CubicO group peptidase (beta-lactamase class C family)